MLLVNGNNDPYLLLQVWVTKFLFCATVNLEIFVVKIFSWLP